MNRDELIEAGRDAMGRNDGWRWWHPRHLARLLDVWEPLIRADERRRELLAVCECGCKERDAHAEAVAARLVEVICERDERVGYWHRRWDFAQGQMDAMGASLLAARAEVAALAEKLAKCTDDKVAERVAFGKERNALKAEVAALREQVATDWAMDLDLARRRVLADMRAKVEELRDEAKADPVGSAVWRTTAYESVLALIEEADMPRSVFDAPAGAATKPLDGDQ